MQLNRQENIHKRNIKYLSEMWDPKLVGALSIKFTSWTLVNWVHFFLPFLDSRRRSKLVYHCQFLSACRSTTLFRIAPYVKGWVKNIQAVSRLTKTAGILKNIESNNLLCVTRITWVDKKICYRRRTARRAMSFKILSTIETICTTNSQQIEVMELEGYSWSTCSKQPRLVDCRVSSTSSTVDGDDDECCWQRDWLAAAKFPSPEFGTKFQRKVP